MSRPDLTAQPAHLRTPPIVLGMVLFIASEVMFFGGLFGAYFTLRGMTDPWPPLGVRLDPLLMGIATGLLVASSATMHRGTRALADGDRRGAVGWLVLTSCLGLVFLGFKVHDWLSVEFSIGSHAYGTLFFGMTGAHAIHLAVGVLILVVVLGRIAQGAYGEGRVAGPEAAGYYWHFVDVVWLGMYATIFFIR